jgi:subfamily B ATP-binding cassette protein MsbA
LSAPHHWLYLLAQTPRPLILGVGALILHTATTLLLIPLAQQLGELPQRFTLPTLGLLLGQIVGLYFFKNSWAYLQTRWLGTAAYQAVYGYRSELYQTLLAWPLARLQQESPGELAARLSHDLEQLRLGLRSLLTEALPASIQLLCLLGILVAIQPLLAGAVLLGGPLAALILNRLARSLEQGSQIAQNEVTQLQGAMVDTLLQFRTVFSFGLQTTELTRFVEAQSRQQAAQLTLLHRVALTPLLMGSLQIGLIAGLLYFCGWLFAQGQLSLGQLTSFGAALALSIDPVLFLTLSLTQLGVARGSWQRLQKLSHAPPALPTITRVELPADLLLEARHLSFAYPGHPPVWQHLQLQLRRGEWLALSAPSGTGKSTLLHLLAGLYAPEQGEIYWSPALEHLYLLPQRAELFQRSLRDNLFLGQPEPNNLSTILHTCCLETVIARLPQGLETPVGLQGDSLSGGERQRVALARALIHSPQVLFLDEATSEIDEATEAKIYQSLRQNWPDLAVIIVAHRPSSLAAADRHLQLSAHQLQPI